MTFPLIIISGVNDKSTHAAKVFATTVTAIYFVLFILAIYLAVRDMQFLPKTSTKIWVLVLAIFFPDLYVLLHGVSSSAQGISFFSGSPMPGSSSPLPPSMAPTSLNDTSTLASSL